MTWLLWAIAFVHLTGWVGGSILFFLDGRLAGMGFFEWIGAGLGREATDLSVGVIALFVSYLWATRKRLARG